MSFGVREGGQFPANRQGYGLRTNCYFELRTNCGLRANCGLRTDLQRRAFARGFLIHL